MAHAALKDHDIDASQYVHISQTNYQYSPRFQTHVYDYSVTFNAARIEEFDDIGDLFAIMYASFEHIFDVLLHDFHEGDYVRIVILSEFLETPISLPYVRVSEVTMDQVFDAVANVLNSQDKFSLTDGFEIHILRTALPRGAGRIPRSQNLNIDAWISKKLGNSIIQVKNDDNICLARAIVIAIEAIEHKLASKAHFTRFVHSVGHGSEQTKAAMKLHQRASLQTCKTFYDLNDAAQLQAVLSGYTVHIYDKFGEAIFVGPPSGTHIYLLHIAQHFMVIRSMKSFTGSTYYCQTCQKGHGSPTHCCTATCQFCHHIQCINTSAFSSGKQTCNTCGANHYSDACVSVHRCIKAERCTRCYKYVQIKHRVRHINECCKFRCTVCRAFFDLPKEDHSCFVQKLEPVSQDPISNDSDVDDGWEESEPAAEPVKRRDMLFFYDIETNFVGSGFHSPNLIVCATPYDTVVFKGESMAKDFFEMISSYLKKTRHRLVFIGHNASGFDNTIILREAYNQGLKPDKIFYRGSKILLLELNRRVRFLCSYLFLPFSLRNLAKNFGLKSQKLYFPYLVNRSNYDDPVIPFPGEHLYNPESLRTDVAYDEFKKEYDRTKADYLGKGKLFNLDRENEIYCTNDTVLLKEICLSFSAEFENMTTLAPFSVGITLPSVCLTLYRMQHLKSSTLLPVFPSYGIETRTRYSKIASTWIQYESIKRGLYIHAGHNTGEATIGKYRPDGFARHPSTGICTVFEFYGLYPAVMVTGEYSVGKPQILYGFDLGPVESIDFVSYRGLLYVKILPPNNIGIAVLPMRTKEHGLVFTLCAACGLSCKQEVCDHSPSDRALTGVWSHIEINVALRENYKILEIYEIYHFSESSNDVFKSYIRTFIAAKIANSGFPPDVVSDNDQDRYVNDMFQQTGGKFSQRTNQKTAKVIRSPVIYYKLHNNPAIEIDNIFLIDDSLIHVTYTHLEDTLVRGTTCLMVAIETTAFARIKLYETLKAIGPKRLAYCDTDSVVFETPSGAWKPSSGNFFGQMQDEVQIKFGGGHLNRFVALGCKTYGMEIVSPDGTIKHELHCKGISLNIRTRKVINFESMLKLLKHNCNGTLIMEDPYFIRRIKKEAKLASVYLKKKLRFTFKKRRVNFETYETVPLGYRGH